MSLFVSRCVCVNYPVYLVPVFWVWFRLSTRYFPVYLVSEPCLVLPWCPDSILLFEFTSSSACPCSSLLCAPWQESYTHIKQWPKVMSGVDNCTIFAFNSFPPLTECSVSLCFHCYTVGGAITHLQIDYWISRSKHSEEEAETSITYTDKNKTKIIEFTIYFFLR